MSLEEKGIKACGVAQQKEEWAAESWIIWGYRDVTSSLCQAVKFFVIPIGQAANTNKGKNVNFCASPPLSRTYIYTHTHSKEQIYQCHSWYKLFVSSMEKEHQSHPNQKKHRGNVAINYVSKELF